MPDSHRLEGKLSTLQTVATVGLALTIVLCVGMVVTSAWIGVKASTWANRNCTNIRSISNNLRKLLDVAESQSEKPETPQAYAFFHPALENLSYISQHACD